MDRARRTRTAAVVAAVLMLAAASPASAKLIKPKPGPWVGKTIQRVTPEGTDQSFDLGRKLTFTLVRVRGGPNPRYRVKNFKAVIMVNIFKPGAFRDCNVFGLGLIPFSARASPRSPSAKRVRFSHFEGQKTFFPEGYNHNWEGADGVFKSRLRAKGVVLIDWDTEGTELGSHHCSLRAPWVAHRK